MKKRKVLTALLLTAALATTAHAQTGNDRYIEVTGTSEIEIVPDEIHYIIEIREYWAEEFDGKSKPEDYRTKVPLAGIEKDLRTALKKAKVGSSDIRTQEVGDYWRERGRDFLVAKQFDITLKDFGQIDAIVNAVDTRGINSMRIGELKNKEMQAYRRQGKIEALKAARDKAEYLVETYGKKLGGVIRIIEPQESMGRPYIMEAQSNVYSSQAASFDAFRTIKLNYSMTVRFEITDDTPVIGSSDTATDIKIISK